MMTLNTGERLATNPTSVPNPSVGYEIDQFHKVDGPLRKKGYKVP